ncbi:MAG: hypothetical protein ACT4N4_13990 [Rhodospirillales bacterium]
MTSCRASRRAPALAAALALAFAGAALAQGASRPLPLTPPQRQAPPVETRPLPPPVAEPKPAEARPAKAKPAEIRPAAQEPQPVSAETAKPGEASVAPVTSGQLPPIDIESLGMLSEANGGFGVSLWAETRRDIVEALLPRLPAALGAPSLQSLQRRLLLSIASPPQGQNPARNLMTLRVERLLAMGDLANALELVRAVPARQIDPAMAEARASALLLTDDVAASCLEARQRLAAKPSLFWDKLAVFCDLLARDPANAQLGAAMVRDQGDKDAAFFTLVDALSGSPRAEVKSLPDANALTLAMMRAAKQQLPADTGPRDRPMILAAVARAANAPPGLRLEAAHRAALLGALPADELAKMFQQAEFAPAQLAGAFSEAAKLGPAPARALLYRAAKNQSQPQGRAEALRALFQLGRQDGDFALLALAALPLLKEMPAQREQAWFAADAGRALYAAGQSAVAKGWLDVAEAAAANDRDAAAAVVVLWPLARIADGDAAVAWDAQKLAAWRGAAEAGKPDLAEQRIAMALTLFDALGDPVIGADWQPLYRGPAAVTGAMPSPMAWFGIRLAAAEKRVGLTVLYALVGLGETELARQTPVNLGIMVWALKTAGLEREARAVALDAAIAAGL